MIIYKSYTKSTWLTSHERGLLVLRNEDWIGPRLPLYPVAPGLHRRHHGAGPAGHARHTELGLALKLILSKIHTQILL